MSNYKVEFTLKQHTPIIHFQSEQMGATLRATELKPKFDRFLKEYVFKNDFEQYKQFLVGYDKNKKQKDFEGKEAFNYKVNITCKIKIAEPIERDSLKDSNRKITIATFFANMGEDWKKNPKKIVWSENENIQVQIISFEKDLIKKIIEYFEEFIFTTNFGMRQSKGFGSFEVISSTSIDFKKYKEFLHFNNVKYKFVIDLKDSICKSMYLQKVSNSTEVFEQYRKLFEILNNFSKTYRSGINQQGYYFKSLMYKYAKEFLKVTWDKKYFKLIFLGDSHFKIKEQREKHNYPDILNYTNMPKEYLLRDLLGLSTSQKWSKEMTIEHKEFLNEIKRYKSPITFKIIKKSQDEYYIYLIVEPIAILNKSFQISNEKKDLKIKTPEHFDIYHYLKFCFDTNIDTVVNDKNHNLHKIIKKLYSQLNSGGIK